MWASAHVSPFFISFRFRFQSSLLIGNLLLPGFDVSRFCSCCLHFLYREPCKWQTPDICDFLPVVLPYIRSVSTSRKEIRFLQTDNRALHIELAQDLISGWQQIRSAATRGRPILGSGFAFWFYWPVHGFLHQLEGRRETSQQFLNKNFAQEFDSKVRLSKNVNST